MQIELSEEQAKLLDEVLEATIGDMSPEIAASDNPGYRHTLIERREALRNIRDSLQGAVAT